MTRGGRAGEKSPRSTIRLQDHPWGRCPAGLDTPSDAKTLARFSSLGSTGQAEPAQCLFHEGDPADLVYHVVHGTLKLYRLLPDGRRQIARFVHPGEFLGLTLRRTYEHTAETLEPVEYRRFARERFDRIVDDHPELGRTLYMVAAHELATAYEHLIVLGRKTARERLASFLLDLFDRAQFSNGEREIVELLMTRIDIADYLGLTKETVSRLFTSFRASGLIALIQGDRVELLDRTRLERLARGEGG